MESKTKIIKGLLLLFLLYSCSNNEKDDGLIGLETNKITFSSEKDSATIKTKNAYWGISDIFEKTDSTDNIYYNLIDKDTISISWFATYAIGKDMFVKVEANNTGVDRVATFTLRVGNYWDFLEVTQKK